MLFNESKQELDCDLVSFPQIVGVERCKPLTERRHPACKSTYAHVLSCRQTPKRNLRGGRRGRMDQSRIAEIACQREICRAAFRTRSMTCISFRQPPPSEESGSLFLLLRSSFPRESPERVVCVFTCSALPATAVQNNLRLTKTLLVQVLVLVLVHPASGTRRSAAKCVCPS